MKKKIFNFLILFVFTILFSCKNKTEFVKDKVVTIKLCKFQNEERLITRYKILPLELHCEAELGYLAKVVFLENIIYVLDHHEKALYLFDISGKFLKKIDRIGHGPYEYLSIRDFSIYKNEICILCGNKIIFFDKISLKPLSEKRLNFYPITLKLFEDIIILSGDSDDTGGILNYTKKSNLNVIKSYLPSEINKRSKSTRLTLGSCGFEDVPDSGYVLFNYTFDNSIYKVSDSGFAEMIFIELGEYCIPNKILKSDPKLIWEYIQKNQYVFIKRAFKHKDNLIISLDYKSSNYIGEAYLLQNMKLTELNKKYKIEKYDVDIRVIGTCNQGFIGTIDNHTIIKKRSELLLKSKSTSLSQYEAEFLALFNDNSNPPIILFDI